MLDLVAHSEEAKEEVCVIDDKYITVRKEKGPRLFQEVSTHVEECGKNIETEFLRLRNQSKLLNRAVSFVYRRKIYHFSMIVPKCSIPFQNEQHSQNWNLVRYS